jgi:hypothetical protein
VDCAEPKACTILLRGASKDVLNEVERNLHDAMGVARNITTDPRLVAGGQNYKKIVRNCLYTSGGGRALPRRDAPCWTMSCCTSGQVPRASALPAAAPCSSNNHVPSAHVAPEALLHAL